MPDFYPTPQRNYDALPPAILATYPRTQEDTDVLTAELTENQELLKQVAPEVVRRLVAYEAAGAALSDIGIRARELNAAGKLADAASNTERLTAMQEALALGSAADVAAIASNLRLRQDARVLIQDCEDWVFYVLRPAATLLVLTTHVDYLEAASMETSLCLRVSRGRTSLALSPVFAEEGTLSFVGERTQGLEAADDKLIRLLALARQAVLDEQAKQQRFTQGRLAAGLTTRAELAAQQGGK